MPSVTVITPNYNHARYLPKRLDSTLDQTFRDFELIILDNASTDNSREVIESYA
jgi:glycosyltransferase involved in cell wall biosynthesis